MKIDSSGNVTLAPTDLSNHLGCQHLTSLEYQAISNEIEKPIRTSSVVAALQLRGVAHEADFKEHLVDSGLTVVDATGESVQDLMKSGVDVIYQAKLSDTTWYGFADFLVKVDKPSELGEWSYEVFDTKLAKETKGGTILQLCVYTFLLSKLQGEIPEYMYAVVPGNNFKPIHYRVDDFSAYFRLMESGIEKFLANQKPTYPEKVPHCDVCTWWPTCNDRRRKEDHLCFVAGITNRQIVALKESNITTLTELAKEDTTKAVEEIGSSLIKVVDQARIQLLGKEEDEARHAVKEPFDDEEHGFRLLPEPTSDDIFLDFEGDHFAEDGVQEYLTGYVTLAADGREVYSALWAETHEQEKAAFETFMDFATDTLRRNPHAHIYHFAPYEKTALKRLMGRYATKAKELDELLRGEVFVDLHTIVKRSLIASVESYSLKNLEVHYKFSREQDLREATASRRIVEAAIETGGISDELNKHRVIVEQYNCDDCVSMIKLQKWLEGFRQSAVNDGYNIPRPDIQKKEASANLSEFEQKLMELRDKLLHGVPAAVEGRTKEENARYILAHILEFHRREDKAAFWEKFRVLELDFDELEDDRKAITSLKYLEDIDSMKAPTQRYTFPPQELDARTIDTVFDYQTKQKVGSKVVAVNYAERLIDIKKMVKTKNLHPSEVLLHGHFPATALQDSLIRLAESVLDKGFSHQAPHESAINLLLGTPLTGGKPVTFKKDDETNQEAACRLVTQVKGGVLAIQGPPGTGKTFTASHMICACKKAGLKVGVTAVSHDVVINLLEETMECAKELDLSLSTVHCQDGEYEGKWDITKEKDYDKLQEGLSNDSIDVLGGTVFCWARPAFTQSVDVLFIDEAGQMALGNALAAAQGGKTLVILGDPQQLEQPTQSSHPENCDVSALEYFLDGAPTMPADKGMFLEETHRLHPSITKFTSEVYYEGRLTSVPELVNQEILGCPAHLSSGLEYLSVEHKGNTSKSIEEVEVVADIVDELLQKDVQFCDKDCNKRPIAVDDILIVSPYNAQVAILIERLPELSHRIGTVNRFQGKGAPVVIYSMASSSSEDVPRGMEFLYDPHRLNVATSRAKALCIIVGSPALLAPVCKSPTQMKMANGLCRYLELSVR